MHRLLSMLVAVVLGLLMPGCTENMEMSVDEVQVTVISEKLGFGRPARQDDVVCIDYRVFTLPEEGHEELRWGTNFCFMLGHGAVVAALDDTVVGMKPGGERVVKVPPHKHWGRPAYDVIPENATLEFHIKLAAIE